MPVIVAGIAVVVLVVGGIAFATLRAGEKEANERAVAIETSIRELPAQDGFVLGSAQAPAELTIYEDFQCPFCIKFTADIEPTLVREYVSTGKLRLVFQNFPVLGLESELAARASVCAAEQDRSWNLGLKLFAIQASEGQVEGERLNVGRFKRAEILQAATDVGLDSDKLDACLDTAATSAAVQEQAAEGTAAGIRGTPGFVLNGQMVVNPPSDIAGWRKLIDAAQ